MPVSEYVAYALTKAKFNIEKDGCLLLEYLTREEVRGWLSQTLEPGDEFVWDKKLLILPPEAKAEQPGSQKKVQEKRKKRGGL